MKLEIKEIDKKEIWENFLFGCDEKTFLQSWNWGEFQKLMGNKIWRFGVFEDNNLISTAFFYKVWAKRGTFLFVPHGPNIKSKIKSRVYIYGNEAGEENEALFDHQKSKILEILIEKLKEIAKEEKCDFIRIAPILKRNEENIEIFKKLGFKEAPIHIHPELTWELDIIPSEEELLMKMRKTTRYLIRQAQKNKEIKIIKSQDLTDIEKFNNLYQETVNRHHFVPFPLDYLKNEFLAFSPDNQITVYLGKYKNEIVSGGIFIFWQGMAFYHHGASSLKYPKIPVSYLLLWEAIKEAKNRGYQKFNFWGIAPIIENRKLKSKKIPSSPPSLSRSVIENLKRHPWAGLTLFKMGFGGYKKEYVKTQDFPLSKKYWLNFIIEKLRKTRRGL